MDLTEVAKRLGVADNRPVVRKAAEFRRLCDLKFNSSSIGVGGICKAVVCLEIASTRFDVIFDRLTAIRLCGMPEKAYNRSFNSLQNMIDIKNKLDVRELGIQFGCVRLIPIVRKGLSLYKDRFLASLAATRRSTTDFTRPVKVDKTKLIELCGTSESEFSSVSVSMKDLCFDVFEVTKEKKVAKEVKGYRELLDLLPEKRRYEDVCYLSDEEIEPSSYKKQKQMEQHAYEKWKSSVFMSNDQEKDKE